MALDFVMNDSTVQSAIDNRYKWQLAIICVVFVILLMFFLFWNGIRSAVSLWIHSGTYNHCFLILPIFFYMVWSDRTELKGFTPRPSLWGGGVILLFASLWLLCFLSGVAEGVQFAIIGIVQGVFLTLFGWRVYVLLAVPFCYLWLLVPSGEFIVPTLQLVTAKSAAGLLDLVGIATFRDGIGIEVPSGAYIVAPGCAGLNFVLAALATSAAYAELIYRSWRRRVAFVLALLALAVVGNALRVFLIIAIAHATNNIGDIVDDHILYGWGFFSLLLFAAMALGQRFRQDRPISGTARPRAPASPPTVPSAAILTAAAFSSALVVTAPLVVGLCWPDVERPVAAIPNLSCGSLETVAARPEWPTIVKQVDALESVDCADGRHVHFTVAVLERPVRDGKLLGVERWIAPDEGWNHIERKLTSLQIAGHRIPVQADLETRGSGRRLIWSLFWAGGTWRTPGLRAALADLGAELAGHRRAVLVLAATEVEEDAQSADLFLRNFLASQPLEHLATDGYGRSN